jgi:3-hydroxy-9,10-secoandrosta-1,3,5(10)-triene-9,17-dione monooxygenase
VQAFEDAGFYRILQPAAYGGYEYWPTVLYDVVAEVARHCPSSAWSLGIVAIHNWEVGLCDPRIAEDLWREDPNVRFSSSYGPFGTARKVDGGYVVEGTWGWSSGCDQCSWVILGAIAEIEPGARELIALYVAPGDYEIDQASWNSAGLTGSGSKDIVVKGAFVPEYRVHNISRAGLLEEPGRHAFPADTYKLPWGIVFGYSLIATILGIADGAIEHMAAYLAKRTGALDGAAFVDDPLAQQILAEAYAAVDGCHLRLKRDFDEMRGFLDRGEPIPLGRRALYKWNLATISRTCANAVNSLTLSAGGSSFARSNPMQRYFRDINTGVNHAFLTYQRSSTNFGKYLLTGNVMDPLL